MALSRRQLLARSSAAGVGLAVAGSVPMLASPALASTRPSTAGRTAGPRPFPPLVDDPAGRLALPAGFRYHVLRAAGVDDLLDGAGKSPGSPDGMASFVRRGARYLITNHELEPKETAYGVPHVAGTVYDAGAPDAGGCTVTGLDRGGHAWGQWVGISGTVNNCAGGATPWGTWLTCEQDTVRAGDSWEGDEVTGSGTYEKDHGFVFEVVPGGPASQDPTPIKAFGRFAHEAVVVEPSRRRVYLTEDASKPNGLFYRWSAPDGVTLSRGVAAHLRASSGRLEAMQVRLDDGSVLPDLSYITSAQLGRPFDVRWVDVPDRLAKDTPTREQLLPGTDVTASKKLEGLWGDERGVYVVASYAYAEADLPADATKHNGQVWFYDYRAQTLTLVTYFPHQASTEAADPAVRYTDLSFDGPDNVTVTPWGSLILAEDGVGASHVLSATPGGPTYAVARNQIEVDGEFSEFCGPHFSPDGTHLFVNIQGPGLTVAIAGPWSRYLG
ncbi:MAG: DUF839 domain-containing protein [Actinomycetota bacterium]|nr:MAG: DUF839 domain-containing protein [Actinomycetota bacterium]